MNPTSFSKQHHFFTSPHLSGGGSNFATSYILILPTPFHCGSAFSYLEFPIPPLRSVMASSASAIAASKTANAPKGQSTSTQAQPAQTQTGSVSLGDNYGQRRSNFSAGASSRSSSAPRNNQVSRKQHKGSKRYKGVVDEDAMAESVRKMPACESASQC